MKKTDKPKAKPTPKVKLKRGQWNKDQTKQFWAYHPTGKEMWVTPARLEDTREPIKLGQFKIKP